MHKELVSQKEYAKKLEKFEALTKELKSISKLKVKAAEDNPGNTWHDNFAYEQFDLQEQVLFEQLESLKKSIENSQIIEKGKVKDGFADVYDNLKLKFFYDDGTDEILTLNLGDSNEESITLNSPLGKAIYGKKIGSKITYQVNDNEIKVEILERV